MCPMNDLPVREPVPSHRNLHLIQTRKSSKHLLPDLRDHIRNEKKTLSYHVNSKGRAV